MSKKSKHSRRSGQSGTTLQQHHRDGSILTPPLADLSKMPQMKLASWRDDRLPELLWVALLVTHLRREDCITLFRQFAESILIHEPAAARPFDISLSGLSRVDENVFDKFIEPLTAVAGCRRILSGLMALNDFPGKNRWERHLGSDVVEDGWKLLMRAVAHTLDHQSQESTDCRWFRILCLMTGGKLKLPSNEMVLELVEYPYRGDQRKVRPTIRSTEGAFGALLDSTSDWPKRFWDQCFQRTECWPLSLSFKELQPKLGTTMIRVREVYSALITHQQKTAKTTAIDAQHDTVFGMGLYGLALLQELMRIGASQSISGYICLRTLCELVITLAYLIHKNDSDTWRSYRVFGAGQAKLQYLKLDEATEDTSYVDIETLIELANEDLWEEYLPIELGHWANSNLRDLSIGAGVKNVYDEFYAWTSTYAHGHWGAMRDSVYVTCGNPLHRLHRIPRVTPKNPPDVIPDACLLMDRLLSLIDSYYPSFSERVTIQT
jgi:hypothetical protein